MAASNFAPSHTLTLNSSMSGAGARVASAREYREELKDLSTVAHFATVQKEGTRWANTILKDYLILPWYVQKMHIWVPKAYSLIIEYFITWM